MLLDSEDSDVPSVCDPLEKYELARDLSHPGINFHRLISNDFLRKVLK